MKRWTKFVRDTSAELKDGGALYSNNRYHVIVYRHRNPLPHSPDIWHLSIRNNDRSAKRDWRDFQRIKNEFLGPEHEAVEIYPAESQLADMANQFHIWAFDAPTWLRELGLGFADGRHVWDGKGPKPFAPDAANAVQRPLDEEPTYGDPIVKKD